MDKSDRMPRLSYDLIDFLDSVVARPELPNTAGGFADLSEAKLRKLAFTSGARQLVDELIAQRAEENQDEAVPDDTSDSDGPFLRRDRVLPVVSSSVFVDGGEPS